MSVTITSNIVSLDVLIPRVINTVHADMDVERLLPWVFRQKEVVVEDDIESWPDEDFTLSFFFDNLLSDCALSKTRSSPLDDSGIESVWRAVETIKIPLRNWDSEERKNHLHFIKSQGMLLKFPISTPKMKYIAGGTQYQARSEGQIAIGPREKNLPIISYTGWFIGQTWRQFLGEKLSIMLGQLASNLGAWKECDGLQDQEVFVVGFYDSCIHVARGVFTLDTVLRAHSQGLSQLEAFNLEFTRGYNLCLKCDWLEGTRVLTRLFRYLFSGSSKVSAVRVNP
ncbi:hypothetical protein BO70DRAFT_371344 [Aspergillus heteromorphus CBS 117.55]|uniref:Uncharacterized protein n=1 Tax=Aspergillus heteromorphus CBS 117.55 TaxID=1448321 RepID=A0A317WAA5_9EURO|nr:uncharacterized protein BO70DRAFT_371344 [Aspergillus heteromorphus CBS 117.55]PWY81928.1 hypothetical protein BO70DRAFT_371344 [Aspergillus heteromorphus CBS 117.55]